MDGLKICFPTSDVALKDTIRNLFGENIDFVEERSVTAMDIVFVAIIPSIGLTVQLVDFILTHFVKDKEKPLDAEEEMKKEYRKIEVSNSRISLYNYSAEEATAIIKSIIGDE